VIPRKQFYIKLLFFNTVILGQVSRAGFYRWRQGPVSSDDDLDLRDELQRIAVEFPYYGWRRMQKELEDRGWVVNHKRVRRIMREDNLLCLRRRKFVVTTDSDHDRRVYPNLAAELELTGLNQLWVADITYIRLELEFVYLAVVLDAFSRRVIGGRCNGRWKTILHWRLCGWRCGSDSLRRAWCITRIAACSTPPAITQIS
jgi:helix-turn-helix protein